MHTRQRVALSLLILGVSILCRSPAVQDAFLWDDPNNIQKNIGLRSFANARHLLTRQYFHTFKELSYRPVASFSYLVDYQLSALLFGRTGGEPRGELFHFVNVLLNAANAVGVFWLAWLLTRQRVPALLAGLLFGIHPVQTEVAAVIAFREDLLCALFLIAATLLFWSCCSGAGPRLPWPVLAAATGVALTLALLSKETALIAPALLVVFDLSAFRERPAWSRVRRVWLYALVLALCGAFAVLRLALFRSPAESAADYPLGTFWGTAVAMPAVVGRYVAKIVFPVGLSPFWKAPQGAAFLLYGAVCALLVAAVAASMVRIRRRNSVWAFGCLWFVLALGPVLQIVPLANLAAERFLYVPMIGACIGLAAAIGRSAEGQSARQSGRALRVLRALALTLVLILVGTLSLARTRVWSDTAILWKTTLAQHPRDAGAHSGVAKMYAEKAENPRFADLADKAIREYVITDKLDQRTAGPLFNVALFHLKRERLKEAEQYVLQALQRDEQYAPAWGLLGQVYWREGRPEDAMDALQRAIELDPESVEAMNTAAAIRVQQGKYQEAAALLLRGLQQEPGNLQMRYNLGICYKQLEDWQSALAAFSAVVAAVPNAVEARLERALCLLKLDDAPRAERELRELLLASADFPLLHYYLGQACAARGKTGPAVKELETFLRQQPEGEEADQARALLQKLQPQAAGADSP